MPNHCKKTAEAREVIELKIKQTSFMFIFLIVTVMQENKQFCWNIRNLYFKIIFLNMFATLNYLFLF